MVACQRSSVARQRSRSSEACQPRRRREGGRPEGTARIVSLVVCGRRGFQERVHHRRCYIALIVTGDRRRPGRWRTDAPTCCYPAATTSASTSLRWKYGLHYRNSLFLDSFDRKTSMFIHPYCLTLRYFFGALFHGDASRVRNV